MEDVKMSKVVTTVGRVYRVTYYPKKWYRKSSLEVRRLGIMGQNELVCKLKHESGSMMDAYNSNYKLLDIIQENDKFFVEGYRIINLDVHQEPKKERKE